jgi:hypothetical protein
VADRLSGWGYRLEAVAPAEEAVQLRREQAAANPAFAPDLAAVLLRVPLRQENDAGTGGTLRRPVVHDRRR